MNVEKMLSHINPEDRQEVVVALNSLRNAVLAGAAQIEDSRQLQRFLDGIAALAQSIEGMHSANQRPIDKTITKIREAAVNIGFGKFATREGRQEKPEN